MSTITEQQRARRRLRRRQSRDRARATATASGARRVLRIAEAEAVTGKGRSHIYDEVEKGRFPGPVPLSDRAVGWLSDEVDTWLDERIAARAAKK
jgi:prophage regulatory protein